MRLSLVAKASIGLLLVGGVGASLWLTVNRGERRSSPSMKIEVDSLTKEQLIRVLRALLQEFHGVFVELANMVQRLKQLGALRGPDGPMSSEQIAEFLMQQGIQTKLDAAQSRILIQHGVRQESIEEAQDRFESDEDIKLLVEGFTGMFDEASRGLIPILPGLEIPKELSEDAVLDVLNKIHQERVKGFRVALEKFWSSPEAENVTSSTAQTQGQRRGLY